MKITSQKQGSNNNNGLLLDINITTTKTTYILQIKSTDRPHKVRLPQFLTQKQSIHWKRFLLEHNEYRGYQHDNHKGEFRSVASHGCCM